jgi:PAS domain S-box-containing protein
MPKKPFSFHLKLTTRTRTTFFILLTAIAYTSAALLGLTLATINNVASPVWPATGIAIGCVYLFGYPAALGVLAGAFVSNLGVGLGVGPTLLVSLGNALEAIFAVWLFQQLIRKPYTLGEHSRAIFGLITLASAAMVSATNATVVLYTHSLITYNEVYTNWLTWWVGDTLGALFIVPLLFSFSNSTTRRFSIVRKDRWKLPALALMIFATNWFVFYYPPGGPFFILLLLPVLLVAQTLGPSWNTLFSLVTCCFAIFATVQAHGPFTGSSMNENLIHLQLFLGALGLTSVGLSSLQAENFSRQARMALLLGWTLTGIAVHSFYSFGAQKDQVYFESRVEEAENEVRQRLDAYAGLLKSGASFFESSVDVTVGEWRMFARRILHADHDEVDGMGVIFNSPTARFEDLKKYNKIEKNLKPFAIKPIPDVAPENQVQNPEAHYIVTYLEPTSDEIPLIGFDFSTEKNRYEAALKARNTGEAILSKQVALIRKNSRPPGFLLFYPFHESHLEVEKWSERIQQHKGFIFATINASKFLKSTLSDRETQVLLTIYEDGSTGAPQKIYQSPGEAAVSNLKRRNHVTLAGQPLIFEWSIGPQFYSTRGYITSWAALTGALCSLFLAVLIAGLENLTLKAQRLVDEKTKELRVQKRQWQVLTETSPVGIFQMDADSNFIYVNPRLIELTGLSEEEAKANHWRDVIHPDDVQGVYEKWQRFLTGEKFEVTFRFVNKLVHDHVIVVVALAVPIKNDLGVVKGYIGTLQDITELQQKQSALVASSRLSSLGEMASGVAHEINNPLTIILGRAQRIENLLRNEALDRASLLAQSVQIVNTTHRIAKIIRGLQSFARETTGEPFEAVRVQDVINNTLELCKERFNIHGVELTSPTLLNEEFQFWGREEQIAQVLMNLLNNAFDAVTPLPTKWIDVQVNRLPNKIQISVTDSGPGISEELEEKIFRPFFTTKDVGKGTGLGLSISKGIVERHGGLLYLDRSSPHTRFILELTLLHPPDVL